MSKNRPGRKQWKKEYRHRKANERLSIHNSFGIRDETAFNAEASMRA